MSASRDCGKTPSGCGNIFFVSIFCTVLPVCQLYSKGTAIRAVCKGARPSLSELRAPPLRARGGPKGARAPFFESARQAKGAELFIKTVYGQGLLTSRTHPLWRAPSDRFFDAMLQSNSMSQQTV